MNEPFLLTLEAAFEQQKSQKIRENLRRGFPPLDMHGLQPGQATISIGKYSIPTRNHRVPRSPGTGIIKPIAILGADLEPPTYPWTTLGTVEMMTEHGLQLLGTGTIIGSNYVLTIRFPQLSQLT